MTKENWQTIGKSGLLGLVFLVLTRLLSEVAFLLAQSMRAFDPNGSFLYISIHHQNHDQNDHGVNSDRNHRQSLSKFGFYDLMHSG